MLASVDSSEVLVVFAVGLGDKHMTVRRLLDNVGWKTKGWMTDGVVKDTLGVTQ